MIEFIDNEDHCRWNGVNMSPEHNLEVMGIDLEEVCEIEGCTIVTGYTENEKYVNAIDAPNLVEAIILYLKNRSYVKKDYSCNNALDRAHGFSKENSTTLIHVSEDFYDDIKSIVLLKDHPEINIELCKEFSKVLDEYYGTTFKQN